MFIFIKIKKIDNVRYINLIVIFKNMLDSYYVLFIVKYLKYFYIFLKVYFLIILIFLFINIELRLDLIYYVIRY